MENSLLVRKKRTLLTKKFSRNLFLFATLIYPALQFLIFYVYVNINSIFLCFQEYDNTGSYVLLPLNEFFRNFKNVIYDFSHLETLVMATKNSLIMTFWTSLAIFPVHIFVAYSIYKKCSGASFFTVILMLPSMVPSIVFLMIFRYLTEYGLPVILGDPRFPSLISNPDTAFGTMIFYTLWTGFAGSLIIVLGAMSRIPPSLIEYGQMEGLNSIREVWYIVIPMIFPTFTVLVIGWVVGFFAGQGPLYAFYEDAAPANIQTIGYYFFVQIIGQNSTPLNYPYASAAGLLFTIIATPITMTIRWLMETYGPNPEY